MNSASELLVLLRQGMVFPGACYLLILLQLVIVFAVIYRCFYRFKTVLLTIGLQMLVFLLVNITLSGQLGESFVNGTGDRTHLGWAGRLCQLLSQQGYPVTYYNLEVRRETSTELLKRWEAECDRRLPIGRDNRIVFSFGTNDTTWENGSTRVELSDSLTNTQQILSVAKAKYPVLMIGPPAIADVEQNTHIQTLSSHFAQLCTELEVPYLDVFSSLSQSSIWMDEVVAGDGAHPNADGYVEYAQLVCKWLGWTNWVKSY